MLRMQGTLMMSKILTFFLIFMLIGCDNSSEQVKKEIYLSDEPGAWPHCSGDFSCRNLHDVPERPGAPDNEYQVQPTVYSLDNGQYKAQAISLPIAYTYFSGVAFSQGKVYAVGGSRLTIAQSGNDIAGAWNVNHYTRFGDAFRGITVAGSKTERLFTTGSSGDIFRTQNSGKSWEPFNMTFWEEPSLPDDKRREDLYKRMKPYRFEGESYDIAFANDNIGLVVGETNILRTTDGGQSWHPVSVPITEHTAWQGIAFSSEKQAWIVGTGGTILRSQNSGETWDVIPLDTQKAHLMSVSFADENHGCLVGDGGGVWCTSNGGADWHKGDIADQHMITKVMMRGSQEGWAVSRSGNIYRTQDGGLHWSLWMSVPKASKGDIISADFWGLTLDGEHGWAVGTAEYATNKAQSDATSSSPVVISWALP